MHKFIPFLLCFVLWGICPALHAQEPLAEDTAKRNLQAVSIVAMLPSDSDLFVVNPEYHWFSSRMNCAIHREEGAELNFSVFMVVAKDSIIYLNVSKFGIELGRMVCTPDSIRLLVHPSTLYWTGTYADVYRVTGFALDYFILQSLLTNADFRDFTSHFDLLSAQDSLCEYRDSNRQHSSIDLAVDQHLTLGADRRIYRNLLKEGRSGEIVDIHYGQFAEVEQDFLFPMEIQIDVPQESCSVRLSLKSPKRNQPGPTGLSIPAKYSRMHMKHLKSEN